jgi:phosphoribosylcarboxyaminoimidazole (NCAIR) mutase
MFRLSIGSIVLAIALLGATAARLPGLIADCTLVPVEGGPHNIGWTHLDEVNSALLEFIAAKVQVPV